MSPAVRELWEPSMSVAAGMGKEEMNALQRVAVTTVFTVTCFTVPVRVWAAEAPDSAAAVPEAGTSTGEVVAKTEATSAAAPVVGVKGRKYDRNELPASVRQRLLDFEKSRRELRDRLREGERGFKGLPLKDRERLREQLRQELDKLLEQQRTIKEEMRERSSEMRTLHPDLSDVIDASTEATKEKAKRGKSPGKN